MKRMMLLLLCLLLPVWAAAEMTEDQAQRPFMVILLTDAACTALPGGDAVVCTLSAGQRVLAVRELQQDDALWYEVLLPASGSAYLHGSAAQREAPLRAVYMPGLGIGLELFDTADPAQVYVEVISLDNPEYPVITLQRIYSLPKADGGFTMAADFHCAGDICKTRQETLLATMYDLQGQPLEVRTIVFDAPMWW